MARKGKSYQRPARDISGSQRIVRRRSQMSATKEIHVRPPLVIVR